MHVRYDDIQTGLHDAQRAAGQHYTLVVQATHQHLHTTVFAAQNIGRWHPAIGEHKLAGVGPTHAQFVEFGGAAETRRVALYNERSDAVRPGAGVGFGVDDVNVCIRTIGDPHLAAIQHKMIAIAFG